MADGEVARLEVAQHDAGDDLGEGAEVRKVREEARLTAEKNLERSQIVADANLGRERLEDVFFFGRKTDSFCFWLKNGFQPFSEEL